jgi:hypothetical protein
MRRTWTAVACATSLSGCFELTGLDIFGCTPSESVPRWEIVIGPIPGHVTALAVGDALHLNAKARPLVGGILDMERGACHEIYGDPVPTVINWYSTDDRIATVSTSGVVIGREAGDAIIVAQAPFRFVSSSVRVRVWVRDGGGP